MFCRHVFGNMSGGFRGISRFGGNFAGFRGNTWISQVRDRAKYQKPWLVKELHVNTKIWCYRVSNPQVNRQNLEILNLQVGKAMGYGCNRSRVSHFKAGTVNITSNLLCRFCHVHKRIEDRNGLIRIYIIIIIYYYYYLLAVILKWNI